MSGEFQMTRKLIKTNGTELVLDRYKEPLTFVKDAKGEGFGYMGTLARTHDNEYVQCHVCGKLLSSLGTHIKAHKLTANEYRDKFGLQRTTKLVSEVRRAELIKSFNKSARHASALARGRKKLAKTKRKKKKQPKMSLEIDNKRGTCPDQIVDKIRRLEKKLGRGPKFLEFKREYNIGHVIISRHFGTWTDALRIAGITIKNSLIGNYQYTHKDIEHLIQYFYKKHGRTPSSADFNENRDLPPPPTIRRRYDSLNAARRAAGVPVIIRMGREWVETFEVGNTKDTGKAEDVDLSLTFEN